MLKVVRRAGRKPSIDLQTVKETLLYMESDCRSCPGLEGVAAALGHTITEIDRVAGHAGDDAPPQVVSARFLPAGL